MSECSEDYNQIVAKFLQYTVQWKKVPQIIYLTIKAMFQHSEMIEENILRNKQLITQQSIKLRQLQLQVKNNYDLHESIDQLDEISPFKQSGFKKSKKLIQRSINSKNQYSGKGKIDNSFSNFKSVQSHRAEKVYDYEQYKKIALDICEQKMQIFNSQLKLFHNLKKQMETQIEQNEKKIQKFLSNYKQEEYQKQQIKIRDIEKQYSNKLQLERTSMRNFVEQTAHQNIKIWREIDNIYMKLDKFIQQSKFCYSNPIFIKDEKLILQKQKGSKEKKQTQKFNQLNENKLFEMQASLNKQFMEFKHKILKQMSICLKLQNLQPVIKKSQTEMIQKISKMSKTVNYLQKQLNAQKRQNLHHAESKASIMNIKQLKQEKKVSNSEQSLKSIQQSLEKLQNYFRQKLKTFKKDLTNQMQTNAQNIKIELFNELKEEMEYRQKNMCEIVQVNCDKVAKLQQKGNASVEMASLKKTIQKLAQQMIMARYLHFGQNECRQFIGWEKEVYSSMQQNFIWKNGSFYVTVVAAGLYRVEMGLYEDNEASKVQAFLMLNNQRISELNQKDVPTNSKAVARGCVFNEAILLPAKSKIAIKVQMPFIGQAYLQIHKL